MQATSFYRKKRVLVTGGAGFIGSYLVEKLVHAGAHVTVLDNLSTGRLGNLAVVTHKIALCIGDITDSQLCSMIMQNIDVVFHLAAAISVPESQTHPEKYTAINIIGTENILRAAQDANVRHVVFSSSAAVYGTNDEACSEEQPLEPSSYYGITKLRGEELCESYASDTMRCTALRYFNVFGERQKPTSPYAGVVARFTHNMLLNMPLTIFGDGLQTRDFISVHDVALANMLIAEHQKNNFDVFNIASGNSITLLALINQLATKLERPIPKLEFLPARPGDIVHSAANCTKFFSLIGK